jgi:apolipoprotein N-acyltransferase
MTLGRFDAGWTGVLFSGLLYLLSFPPYEMPLPTWLVPGLLLVSSRNVSWRKAWAGGAILAVIFCAAAAVPLDASVAFGRMMTTTTTFALLMLGYSWGSRIISARSRPVLAAWLWVVAEVIRDQLLAATSSQIAGHPQLLNTWSLNGAAELGGAHALSFMIVLVSVGLAELLAEAGHRAADSWLRTAAPAG